MRGYSTFLKALGLKAYHHILLGFIHLKNAKSAYLKASDDRVTISFRLNFNLIRRRNFCFNKTSSKFNNYTNFRAKLALLFLRLLFLAFMPQTDWCLLELSKSRTEITKPVVKDK